MAPRYLTFVLVVAFWSLAAVQSCPGKDLKAELVTSYALKRFTTESGLPQNTVRELVQAKNGYLWIGTSAGVARYDGLKFTVYNNGFLRSEGGDARVWDLAEDGEEKIWVRTGEGLACFDHGRWSMYRCKDDPLKGIILASCASQEGGMWLTMPDGVKRFKDGRITRTYTTRDGLISNHPGLVAEDTEGCLWLTFGQGTWQRLDPRTQRVSQMTLPEETNPIPDILLPARSGGVWICGPHEFARELDGVITRYPAPAILSRNRMTHINEDAEGALWFICEQAPRVYQFKTQETPQLAIPPLPSNDIRCVLPGQDGVVWIGTGDEGLLELRPRPLTSLLTTNSLGQKIEFYSVCCGDEGRLWFGTSEGLFRLQNGSFTRFTNSWRDADARYENSVQAVLEDRGQRVWFGVRDQGLRSLAGDEFVTVTNAGCGFTGKWTISTLLEDQGGNLWIGSNLGVVRRAPDGQFHRISAELGLSPEQHVYGLREAPDGSIWFGTDGAGVYEVTGDKVRQFTTREGLASDYATPLCVEADGQAWISTPNGLNRLYHGRACILTTRRGLLDDELYSLVEDSRGFFWATCNRGIFRMSKHDLHAVADGLTDRVGRISFGEVDGLATAECNGECQPNVARAPDGRLWFSTTRGCATVDPSRIVSTQTPLPVVIERVQVDDELVFRGGALTSGGKRYAEGRPPRFPAGRGRVLEIQYTASSFLNPEKVWFAHRLKGHDEAWRDAGTERVAFYTDIPPGEYTFEVKARNEQGTWSPQMASFAFSLAPHLWQTWSFYIACGFAVVIVVAGVQGYRLRWQHRLLKLDEQRALANERARIARDLHDELGTSLTGLALELDVIRAESKARRPVDQRLGGTATHARDIAERMREVVWTINPRCDTVLSLAKFLEQQVSYFLGSDGVRIRLNFPEDIPPLPLGADARHQLALSVREALNNVVRHAQASEVDVSLEITEADLLVQITDDGRGFRTGGSVGQGLLNMRWRMGQIGGTFDCVSEPGRGTTIRLCVPLRARGNANLNTSST